MNIVQSLAIKMCERADALGLKGKKADDDAIAFFAGAATALELAERHDDANHVATVTAFVLSVRGMMEVRIIASKVQEAA